jgi:hypothetical protein
MPRGPGKKENYNLDYGRFSKFDHDDDEAEESGKGRINEAEADAAGGPMPNMRDVLRTMPPELQEAYHLMQISRETGDREAHQRASALALKAVQNGSPQIREEFMKNMATQNPELAQQLSEDPDIFDSADPKTLLDNVQSEAIKRATAKKLAQETPEETGIRIDTLRNEMEEGQKSTRKELDQLAKKQEELERIKSPEEFMKFMADGGITQEDIQRILSGDEEHMQSRFNETIERQMNKDGKSAAPAAAEALKKVDEIHSTLFGTTPEPCEAPSSNPESEKPAKKAPPPPKEPEVIIPKYRLQYDKDENGRYKAVELKCSLPGVADMSLINLDVAEKHLRLSTISPAPKYVVNAGPFPVLITASGARAKYSKKREELSISVPAKVD